MKIKQLFSFSIILSVFISLFSAVYAEEKEGVSPEKSTGYDKKETIVAKKFMVAAANPLAVKAGYDILKKGGTAIDAAIATQLVLNLVEPQSSGIGGGAFILYWDNRKKRLIAYDGREVAPNNVTEAHFTDENKKPLNFWTAVVGGRSVGVPGTVKLLEHTHKKHGKARWRDLFQPAIDHAKNGFIVSERLASLVAQDKFLSIFPDTRRYFFDQYGDPIEKGTLLKNPQFAEVLEKIAKKGARAFYKGEIAQAIVDTVNNAPNNPGNMTLKDLEKYDVVERKAICTEYRAYSICGMPAPTSGGITTQQIIKQLEPYELSSLTALSSEAVHLFAESARLAYADRGLYIADPDFFDVPTDKLLNASYLEKRSSLINKTKSMGKAEAGDLDQQSSKLSYDDSIELPSTSHISIVDSYGNIVSMTTTIENGFGSRLMTNGFLLNNELTDFSFSAEKDGKKIANRVQPGKRPRSSMAPTIVFDKNPKERNAKAVLVIGSPGGSRIINYVAKTIIAVLDWGHSVQEAINLPHYTSRNGAVDLEKGTKAEKLASDLKRLGHDIVVKDLTSGLHGIQFTSDGMVGGADPRREGIVMGE